MTCPPVIPQMIHCVPAYPFAAWMTMFMPVAFIGIGALPLSALPSEAVTVTTTFNNLRANNNSNNGIGSLYQSGDFRFSSGNLFYRGTQSIYYPGSGVLYTTGQDIVLDNIHAIPEPSVALLAALGTAERALVPSSRHNTPHS